MFIPTRQQRDAIKKLVTWWKSKTRQVFEISGLAGCLDENTMILTNKGTITLKDLILMEREDLEFRGFQDFKQDIKVYNGWKYTDISKIYATDIMNGYSIKTKSGLEIKCSEIHPFMTIGKKEKDYKWVKSKDLNIGDMIAGLGNKNIHNNLEIKYDDYYFLGYYLADGYVERNKLQFSSKKQGRLDELKKYLEMRFNLLSKIYYNKDKDIYSLHVNLNNELKKLLEVIGLDVKNKYINMNFLTDANKKYNFLRGLLNDFTIGKNDIEFSNLHKENVERFIILMREFGIVFSGCKEKKNNHGTTFRTLLVKEFCINMYNIFGEIISSKKENSLSNFINEYNKKKPNTNINLYNNLEEVCSSITNLVDIFGTTAYDYKKGRRRISREKLLKLSENTNNTFINNLYNDGFFFDEIISIEPIIQKFYDITVPENSSFVSNSLISHNTGKSTMVNAFIEEIGLGQDEVRFAAYTGKASLVLQRKGINATTIHKLIYVPVAYEEALKDGKGEVLRDKDGRPKTIQKVRFEKKDSIGGNVKLIVLDECSMINEQMWRDLLTFELPIIVLGDKGWSIGSCR